MELAISAAKSDGRIILVIDPAQAIYAFNGADPEVLKSFQERFSPIELPLPICYRCPLKVIKLLQTIVPDILPYSNAIEGEIIDIKVSELQKYAKPGSYVVSRLNAPLIKHCLNFLKNGIPANILGRDMGDNLLYLIKKSKKKKLPELLKWLVKWEKDEKERILLKYPNANTDSVVDKAECINMLCEGAKSVEDVKNNIKDLFKDKTEKNIVLFSSVHRIKGKEADEVFVLTDTLRSFDETEINIKYVALSRVKKKLYLVGK
jgi:superfamily I DNA/RNA helicase